MIRACKGDLECSEFTLVLDGELLRGHASLNSTLVACLLDRKISKKGLHPRDR